MEKRTSDRRQKLDRVLSLWDTDRNGAADGITPGSHRRVWWRCKEGHSWQQKVFAVADGAGCPYCAGYLPVPGENDLATTHPALAAEWDGEKNGAAASAVSAGSAKCAWWRCPEGHSYQAAVYSRMAGTGCPYCAGRRVLAGFNDLLTTDPEICGQWDYEKNDVGPDEINRGSHKKIWWRCELGHSYSAEPYARAAGNGCPYCAGRRVLAGFNDLATTNPSAAAQWAQDLNGDVTPQMVTKGSNRKFWWKCSEGHYWQAAVFSRTRKRASDCPICAGSVKVRFEGRYRPPAKLSAVPGGSRQRPAV